MLGGAIRLLEVEVKIRNLTLMLVLATGLASTGGAWAKTHASEPAAAKPALAPTSDQAQAALWVQRFLSRLHYQPVDLDDAMSEQIYQRYLEALDGEHWFLLQADVEEFGRYRHQLDDAIFEQDLRPPFKIFARYQQRVAERIAHAQQLIEGEFDFTVDERFAYDRADTDWAADAAELDDLWRKRVKNDVLRLELAGKAMPEIRKTLRKRYRDLEIRINDLDHEDVFQIFLNAYSTAIDPHTNYLSPRASENFQMQMRLSLEGIGALLRRDGDYTTIQSLVPGGPAQKNGQIKPGDRILAIGQGKGGSSMVDVIGWRTDDVVDLIRGKRNTWVRLDVLPAEAGADGQSQVVSILRDEVKLEEQAAQKRIMDVEEDGLKRRIGVIELPTFYLDFAGRASGKPDYRSSTRDVKRLLGELEADKVDGVVIDLRGNGGGSLTEATELTGLFIDQGPVVQVRNSQGRVEVETDPNPGVVYDGPLLVLVDRGSASASEIFAGAIQDYGRGLVLGERTYGKGTVQQLVDLDHMASFDEPRLGQLKMTMAQFFRVSGSSTQHKGVEPDIAFPSSVMDGEDYGESSYANALPWTQIPAARYTARKGLNDWVSILDERFHARAGKDQEYRFLLEDIERYKQSKADPTVSLLLSERKRERDEQEQRLAERRALREQAGKKADAEKLDDGLEFAERAPGSGAPDAASDADDSGTSQREPDILLVEAAHVLADLVSLNDPKLRTALLERTPPATSATAKSGTGAAD